MASRILKQFIAPMVLRLTKPDRYNLLNFKYVTILQPLTVESTSIRYYAKGKDRGKDKKHKSVKVEVNLATMAELIPVDKLQIRSKSTIEKMKEDFAKNLSLRSTTGSIESLPVKFEGKDYELQELAQIVRKNPKTMVINFASFPQAIPNALKAIQGSGLNLNPQQDGTTLYVPVPKVTKEHREALAKNAKALYIKCRDTLKEIESEFLKKLKRQTGVSEDLIFSVSKQVSALSDEYQEEAKKIYETKHNELLKQ